MVKVSLKVDHRLFSFLTSLWKCDTWKYDLNSKFYSFENFFTQSSSLLSFCSSINLKLPVGEWTSDSPNGLWSSLTISALKAIILGSWFLSFPVCVDRVTLRLRDRGLSIANRVWLQVGWRRWRDSSGGRGSFWCKIKQLVCFFVKDLRIRIDTDQWDSKVCADCSRREAEDVVVIPFWMWVVIFQICQIFHCLAYLETSPSNAPSANPTATEWGGVSNFLTLDVLGFSCRFSGLNTTA